MQFADSRRRYVQHLAVSLPAEIEVLAKQLANAKEVEEKTKLEHNLKAKQRLLQQVLNEQKETGGKSLDQLPERTRNLHARAFTTNTGDSDYRQLASLQYDDGKVRRELQIPKGDILHQFREDVAGGKQPTISWIVAPENFSDHPGAPWYGTWYLADYQYSYPEPGSMEVDDFHSELRRE